MVCEYCKKPFYSRRQHTMHYDKCFKNHQLFLDFISKNNNSSPSIDDNTITLQHDDNNDEQTVEGDIIDAYTTEFPQSLCLLNQKNKHIESGNNINFSDDSQYRMQVNLLALLNRAQAPNYLFDEIISCIKTSFIVDGMHINSLYHISRKRALDSIKKKHNFEGLESKNTSYHCVSQHLPINVVWHDFGQCLYSLLTDMDLMKPENLLDEVCTSEKYDDINSGTVYIDYYNNNIKNPNSEKLIPIIFFTDKTHTDNHGRLCLEPVQFTLGIFNRKIRNQSRAWRTLGYATESIYVHDKKKIPTSKKQQDYHNILKIIFESYIDYQKNPRIWDFKCSDGVVRQKKMIVPVLFIIGDTEGHDKLCGRICNRNKIKRPCRYCNISYENSDQPDCKYIYTKVNQIKSLIERNKELDLKELSMYNIQNTMHLLHFCDDIRGIHGAVLAELLHCLQLGIFQYAIEQLFLLKKLKKLKKIKPKIANDIDNDDDTIDGKEYNCDSIDKVIIDEDDDVEEENADDDDRDDNDGDIFGNKEDDDNEDDDDVEYIPENDPDKISTHWCFPDTYKGKFEDMCVFYGALLNHQSDRSIPRTKFNTKYMAVTKKNGHEMAGLIIVFLVVLSSAEGLYLDPILGTNRCAAFIQCLELLLMLENFCKADYHEKKDLLLIKRMMPVVLETIKSVINRKHGCGLKIVKFHIINHFVDDIIRFGSMNNFDSSIGERNHITEIKRPAKRTQRRKDKFEQQTADRQIENIGINIAYNEICSQSNVMQIIGNDSNTTTPSYENKRQNLYYNYDDDSIYKTNTAYKTNIKINNWKDDIFYKQLKKTCRSLIDKNHVKGPRINLFTQHNRHNKQVKETDNEENKKNIFRADPFYDKAGPWYDWANVDWGKDHGIIPAKLLIFMDISTSFISTFQIGDCYVTESGYYALGYSFLDSKLIGGHRVNSLVFWGTLLPSIGEIPHDISMLTEMPFPEHKLCIFPVDSIESTCIAVPYYPHQSIIISSQWLILIPRNKWYQKFLDKLNNFNKK